jgi:hypothetical protein
MQTHQSKAVKEDQAKTAFSSNDIPIKIDRLSLKYVTRAAYTNSKNTQIKTQIRSKNISITDKWLLKHLKQRERVNMNLIATLLILGLVFSSGFSVTPVVHGNYTQTSLPKVYVDPANITNPTLIPQKNFTIEVKIANITDFYGFDIRLSWNTSVLNYTSHTVKIPVENYPDGALHEPVLEIKNEVNTTAGTYTLVYTSLSAPSFNGSGTVFNMTFTVMDFGECALNIYVSKLSDSSGQPINHTVENGYFSNLFYDVAVLSVTPSATIAFIGEIVNITVTVLNNGTSRNETFTITTYCNNTAIDTQTVSNLPPNTEETLTFYWNTSSAPPGDYTISANATIVPDETNTENNKFQDGTITLVIEPIHDVAVTALTTLKTLVFKGYCLHVNVTVENQGNFAETFNITIYANNTAINSTQIYLAKGGTLTITFTWNTTDAVEYGDYMLNATATQVVGENDTSDNSLINGNVKVVHPGDLDIDGDVDIFDVVLIASAYGSQTGDPAYDPNFDVNCNGKIDILDIVTIASHYGYKRP